MCCVIKHYDVCSFIHKYTRGQNSSHIHMQTLPSTRTHAYIHTQKHTHTGINTVSNTHAYTQKYTHAHTNTLSNKHTRIQAQTHIQKATPLTHTESPPPPTQASKQASKDEEPAYAFRFLLRCRWQALRPLVTTARFQDFEHLISRGGCCGLQEGQVASCLFSSTDGRMM